MRAHEQNIKSILLIAAGSLMIFFFSFQLLLQIMFLLFGLYLINRGFMMRGVPTTAYFMRFWMGRF